MKLIKKFKNPNGPLNLTTSKEELGLDPKGYVYTRSQNGNGWVPSSQTYSAYGGKGSVYNVDTDNSLFPMDLITSYPAGTQFNVNLKNGLTYYSPVNATGTKYLDAATTNGNRQSDLSILKDKQNAYADVVGNNSGADKLLGAVGNMALVPLNMLNVGNAIGGIKAAWDPNMNFDDWMKHYMNHDFHTYNGDNTILKIGSDFLDQLDPTSLYGSSLKFGKAFLGTGTGKATKTLSNFITSPEFRKSLWNLGTKFGEKLFNEEGRQSLVKGLLGELKDAAKKGIDKFKEGTEDAFWDYAGLKTADYTGSSGNAVSNLSWRGKDNDMTKEAAKTVFDKMTGKAIGDDNYKKYAKIIGGDWKGAFGDITKKWGENL